MTSRRWWIFFVLLLVLAVAAVTSPLVYNLNQQLRPEQVADARQRWAARNLRDYELRYNLRIDDAPEGREYRVVVRDGTVVEAVADDAPARDDVFTVDAVFDLIESGLTEDAAAARRNYTVARFHPELGYPARYVRRVKATGERVELVMRVRPLD
jgi:hypothetical protein